MASVKVIPYEDAHGAYVASRMRVEDRREIYYLTTLTPQSAVDITATRALAAWTATVDDVPAMIFGVNRRSTISQVGMPWMLATDVIDLYPLALARESRKYIRRFFAAFDRLENYVLAENEKTVRWLRWLGFDMDDPAPHGAFGQPFIRFGKNLSCV